MVKQKIVLKLALDDERKRRKAFKAAVGMSGVTSATMEGDKIIIVGDGVDPITLTTMLRRSLGYAELLSVSCWLREQRDVGCLSTQWYVCTVQVAWISDGGLERGNRLYRRNE
uniref:HMA domain-containing protein n=1 Tax=Aegilops tauschii TaxID=37682 RepID=M8C1X0_AEGTA